MLVFPDKGIVSKEFIQVFHTFYDVWGASPYDKR